MIDTHTEDPEGADPAALVGTLAERCVELQERVDQLQTALNSRVIIEQAKGVLAERHGLNIDMAFELLRGHARRNQVRVHDLARVVVENRDLTAQQPAAG